jgi:hypothetical protein
MALLFQSGKSVKDKVIITLGYLWPLKPKEIFSYIKKNLNGGVTYQAVYKSINELLQDGVIVKTDNGLMLNREWVSNLKDYINYTEKAYRVGTPRKEITNSEQTTFECIWDWYYYILMMLEKYATDAYATSVPCIFQKIHAWNALLVGKDEFTRVSKVAPSYKIYSVVASNTLLDHALERYWLKIHIHYRLNVPLHISNDIVVIGDNLFQAIYPQELLDAMEDIYNNTKTIDEMDVERFQREIFYKKSEIVVLTAVNR